MGNIKSAPEGALYTETKSVNAFGAKAAKSGLELISIPRRNILDHDVEIEILYCGVCHSDLHTIRNEWHSTT